MYLFLVDRFSLKYFVVDRRQHNVHNFLSTPHMPDSIEWTQTISSGWLFCLTPRTNPLSGWCIVMRTLVRTRGKVVQQPPCNNSGKLLSRFIRPYPESWCHIGKKNLGKYRKFKFKEQQGEISQWCSCTSLGPGTALMPYYDLYLLIGTYCWHLMLPP